MLNRLRTDRQRRVVLAHLADPGAGYHQLARELQVSMSYVRKILIEYGYREATPYDHNLGCQEPLATIFRLLDRKFTVAEMAKRSGYHESTIWRMRKGRQGFKFQHVVDLALLAGYTLKLEKLP